MLFFSFSYFGSDNGIPCKIKPSWAHTKGPHGILVLLLFVQIKATFGWAHTAGPHDIDFAYLAVFFVS